MNDYEKKVLIISHNPLSRVNNNGKTLTSIFKGLPNKNIYQIYLNVDLPDYSRDCHYFQINEKQIIGSLIKKRKCGEEVSPYSDLTVGKAKVRAKNYANHSKRLIREMIWKTAKWKRELADWLQNKSFDVVFFMAGDGLFAYDIYFFVASCIKSKRCLFFTDDYIIGKSSVSPAASLRRGLLKRKMKKAIEITTDLYVISNEMKQAYRELFGKEGYVIRNFSAEKKEIESSEKETDLSEKPLVMVYAGGLHFNRWDVLSKIANCLKELNASNKRKCILKIYSSQDISKKIINSISVDEASEFCGGVSGEQIANVYNNADILLHVESFDKKAIASTKYSFSTKIPEYLSTGKCVLAVGPREVASIKFLTECTCVISEYDNLKIVLSKIIEDDKYRHSLELKCEEYYSENFSRKEQELSLARILHA